MDVQLKKGVLDLCVLSRLSIQDAYGYDIYQTIDKVLGISESTIYPILRRLVKEGYVTTYLRESSGGPPRKYFRITDSGLTQYKTLRNQWDKFIRDVSLII